jgi:hypothetical protein
MKAKPTLTDVAKVLTGRCPRRLVEERERKAQGSGSGTGYVGNLGQPHHGEVDRLAALYRSRGYWTGTRLHAGLLETPLPVVAELDLVVADGQRAAVVEVKTGELRPEHLFQVLLGAIAWARLEGRVGLDRKVSAVLWHPGLGFPLYLRTPDPKIPLARAREALGDLLAARPRVGPECVVCPLAREGGCPEGRAYLGGGS